MLASALRKTGILQCEIRREGENTDSALVRLGGREGFWGGRVKVLASALRKSSIPQCEIKGKG
ncbi:MAG: hypothetical protein DRP27_07480 [Thermotogae bacterium]|nr:MAG: hypothetical protein DRP27_07480 [Thermotogota bacterium]